MQSGLIINVQSRDSLDGFDFLVKAKALLLLDVSDYDTLLQALIGRAVDDVERFTGIAIGNQIRRISYSILTGTVNLPYGPVKVIQYSTDGATLDDDGRLTANWPTGGYVLVQCGHDSDTIPASLAGAVALAIAEYSGLNPSIKTDSWKAGARRLRSFTWAS